MSKEANIKEEKHPGCKPVENACKLCAPLGACMVYKGIADCVPLIHGSQGCSTYIRRYMISHFKEPVDIASTNFTEETAVFGGKQNFNTAIKNIKQQYHPKSIAVASTCLSETIGDDVNSFIRESDEEMEMVYASTPSYRGTHADGFESAVKALLERYPMKGNIKAQLNILPGFVSPADMRMTKEILEAYMVNYIMLPDYSDTLDNTNWKSYHRIAPGGTTLHQIRLAGSAEMTIGFGKVYSGGVDVMEKKFNQRGEKLHFPMGIDRTDAFFKLLSDYTGRPVPEKYQAQRGRLIDAYVDAHKYIFGKKAVIYGEEDFCTGLYHFLKEIGIEVVLIATGSKSGKLKKQLAEAGEMSDKLEVVTDTDFEYIRNYCRESGADILIGNSKGYYISRELNIPLVRVGFPIHDRVGGQRIKHLFYEGTQELFDMIVNTLIAFKQDGSPVGYKYM